MDDPENYLVLLFFERRNEVDPSDCPCENSDMGQIRLQVNTHDRMQDSRWSFDDHELQVIIVSKRINILCAVNYCIVCCIPIVLGFI
jgi:hypothetical protein